MIIKIKAIPQTLIELKPSSSDTPGYLDVKVFTATNPDSPLTLKAGFRISVDELKASVDSLVKLCKKPK